MSSSTPISDDAIKNLWPVFEEAVRARLIKGASTYGDDSFGRTPVELLREMQQEAMDQAGWGFVLWCRCEAMIRKLEAEYAVGPC